jgi:hypothetical protein
MTGRRAPWPFRLAPAAALAASWAACGGNVVVVTTHSCG